MNNKQDEIQIAIQSEMSKIGKLIDEYEKAGGKVTNVTLLKYDDEEYHHMAMNGTGKDVGELLFSNEHVSEIIEGHTVLDMISRIIEEEKNEQWAKASRITAGH